jgi:dipeptidyl aminopeptidase/acylaminoacyl peptidase
MSNYDVFISYSRKDTDFVRQLFDALEAQQRGAWVDWQGIDYSTKWWEEICAGIDNADNFVLILSPQSLNSLYCHREIEYARTQGKRIIPFIYQTIDEALLVGGWYASSDMRPIETLARANWEYLKSIQWIDFPKLSNFDKAYEALVQTIDSDPEHVKLHTRLLQSAAYWERAGRNPDALLRGVDLRAAESWLIRWDGLPDNDKSQPKPTEAQRSFINMSREAEDEAERLKTEQNQRARRLRRATAIAAMVGVLAVVIAMFSSSTAITATNVSSTAAANADIANTQVADANAALTAVPPTLEAVATEVQAGENRIRSLDLASDAVEILDDPSGNYEVSALLSIRALGFAYTMQADASLVRSTDDLYSRQIFLGYNYILLDASYSPDGRFIVTAGDDNTVLIWDVVEGKQTLLLSGHNGRVRSASYSPDGHFIVTASQDGSARIWDALTGEQVHYLSGHTGAVTDASYSPDGRFIITAGGEGTARIWSATTGEQVQHLSGHTGPIWSASYSPDGRLIVTASIVNC